MESEIEILGHCDEKFMPLKEAFADNFKEGLDVGASLAVTLNGEFVIDLWGGYTSEAKKEPWEKDTIVMVHSTTKIITSLCTLILVDRGELDLNAPVSKYWPEFGQAGKEKILVRHIFSHSAGLPAFDDFDDALPLKFQCDWNQVVERLARQKPWWEPGTASGYHSLTFGFLLGELVRRISGVSIGSFFRTEIADKIGADFHIGLPEECHNRVAEQFWGEKIEMERELDSIGSRIAAQHQKDPSIFTTREYRMAEIPSANGHGNARSVARVGSILAMGGELDGIRFLSKNTLEMALEEQIYVTDHYFGVPVRFGLGFGLSGKEWPLPNPSSLHWGGTGGSYCLMDLDTRSCFAYAMNRMIQKAEPDPRNVKTINAFFNCMDQA